jgi:thymidine kinase
MFKWFGSTKKEDGEEEVIPTPPPANINVALRIRQGNYNPLYYNHPENFNEEIVNISQVVQTQIEEKSNLKKLMPQLAIEIFDEFIDRKHIPLQYIKRFQRKQYRIRHKCLMYQIIRELAVAYQRGLVLKSGKVDHQLLMIALENEIKYVYHPEVERHVHALNMLNMNEELIAKAESMGSLRRDRSLYLLYMRMLKKDILYNHGKYLETLSAKKEQKDFMRIVSDELIEKKKDFIEEFSLRQMNLVFQELKDKREEIAEIYEDFVEELGNLQTYVEEDEEYFFRKERPINKHLKILSEDSDFMQWGTIDPFIVVPQIEDIPFFQDKPEPIYIECDFNSLFSENVEKMKNDIEKEKSLEDKMEEGTLAKYREGYLKIFLGSMFSGKSSRILFELSCMADQRFRCLYVNHVKDERKTESQDKFVTTHNSSYSRISSKIDCAKVEDLDKVNVQGYDYIAIDELQFFDSENTVPSILEWVKQGKYVLIASLDGDAYRRKFGKVLDLLPHADKVKKLTAYCDMCRDNYGRLKPAPFTARMTSDTTAELVGGADLYKAMCRECHDYHLDFTVRKY